MTEDLLAFGVSLVAATPYLANRTDVEVHDRDLGQRLVRRVIDRAWRQRQSRPSDNELINWLLALLDQEKQAETLTCFVAGGASTGAWVPPFTHI